jgi:hypothetical protein
MSWTESARGCLDVYQQAVGAMSNRPLGH